MHNMSHVAVQYISVTGAMVTRVRTTKSELFWSCRSDVINPVEMYQVSTCGPRFFLAQPSFYRRYSCNLD
jgi:hypothetical protein